MLNIYIFFFLTKLHFVTIECTPQMSSSQGLRTSLSTLSITFHSSILMGLCFNLFFAFTNEQKHEQVFMDHKKNSYLYCFLKLVSCRTAVKLWLNLFFFFCWKQKPPACRAKSCRLQKTDSLFVDFNGRLC